MRFTIRELTLDVALLFLAAMVWFTNRHAVFDAIHAATAAVLGR